MRVLARTTLALTLALAVLVPAQLAVAETPDAPGPQLLARPSHGQSALQVLGTKAAEAAKVNGLATSEFMRRIANDTSLWVGRDGRLFYVDSAAGAAQEAGASATEVQAASAALADTFLLHSRPTSLHTVYLDFSGITLAPDSWWVTSGGMSPQTFTGYSQDADPAFNDTEKTFVQQVWSIVAEKYSAFDVDVTTENPGADGYNRTNGFDDLTWGDRVVITSDDNALAQACVNCAGISLIDVFDTIDSGQYEPAWVFTDQVGTATLTANTAAHEVGHTLGLSHDGTASTSYYPGHNQWVPLMGLTNSKAVAQFSKGEYLGANNTEDDLAVMAGNGAPLVPDEAGNATGTATGLPSAASYQVHGIIRSATDKDVYAVSRSCVNDLTATASGIGTGQTLDIKVSVYNSAGTLVGADDVASSNIGAVATGMNAEYTVTNAAASTYYVEVDGVGSGGLGGTPNPSTGYTDYASIGQYTLAITGCATNGNPPTAPQNLTASHTAKTTTGTVSWIAPTSSGDAPVTGYTVGGLPGSDVVTTGTSIVATNLTSGTTYAVTVTAANIYGSSTAATTNLVVGTWVPTAAPGVSVSVGTTSGTVSWTAPANPGGATITGWTVVLTRPSGSTVTRSLSAATRTTSYTGLTPGTHHVSVTVVATADDTVGETPGTRAFTVPDKPSAPQIGTPASGVKGGAITAVARWTAPISTGGSPITGYKVIAYKLTTAGSILKAYYSGVLPSSAQSLKWTTLPSGKYKFRVVAYNAAGRSPYSAYSTRVLAQ